MYKQFFNNFAETLYQKQFGFQQDHSSEYTEIPLIDQINDPFEDNFLH